MEDSPYREWDQTYFSFIFLQNEAKNHRNILMRLRIATLGLFLALSSHSVDIKSFSFIGFDSPRFFPARTLSSVPTHKFVEEIQRPKERHSSAHGARPGLRSCALAGLTEARSGYHTTTFVDELTSQDTGSTL
jgi:hypothetical protein